MNKTDKVRLLSMAKQIEKYVDEIEEIQNKEYRKYDCLSDEDKKKAKGITLENNQWLLQPFHDGLEKALSAFDVIQDLIDPAEEDYEVAGMMANHFKNEFYTKLEKKHPKNASLK